MKTIIYTSLFSFFCFFQGLSQCANSIVFNNVSRSVFLQQTNSYYSGSNGGFTWECWFKLNQSLGTEVRPLIVATDSVVYEDIWLGFGWNGGVFNRPATKLVFKVDGPNSAVPATPGCTYEPTGGFQIGTWYHVAGTMNYTTHTISLFVNGQQVSSETSNVSPITRVIATSLSCPLVENGQLSLNGNMDEVKIWGRPLPGSEIAARYKTCLSGSEPQLVSYYHCNEGVGSQVLFDGSQYPYNGSVPVPGGTWSIEGAPLTDTSCTPECDCPILDAGPNAMICEGGSVLLSATPGWPFYSWSPSADMSDPSMGDQIVSPAVTTTYTVTASMMGPNLVVNGDFSLGNVGFTNEYNYSATYAPCNYYVNNTYFTIPDPMYTDHTPTSDNMMLSIDGCTNGQIVWEQTFTVVPNANYTFSFWATRAGQIQPIFQTIFTGDVTGTDIYSTVTTLPSTGAWIWDQYGGNMWNSGNNNTITITVKNLEINGFGNDFAMDDFSLQMQCNQISQVTVYVNGAPVDLGPDLQLCEGTSHVLQAGSGYQSYLWSNGSTQNTITVTAPGTYWVAASDSCGGTNSDTIHIDLVVPPALELGSDISICAGDTVHFAPITGLFAGYQWAGTGLSCTDCPDPEVFPAASTLFSLVATTPEGCTVTDSITVNIVQLPQTDLGNDHFICAGDIVHLSNAFSLNNYQWSPAATMSCADCAEPTVNPAVSTTYFLTSANSGCTATDSVRVHVSPRPAMELGDNITICKGENAHFGFTPNPLFVTFQWTPASGLSCSDCSHPEANPSDTTLYYLQATTAQGCTTTDSITVFVRDDAPQNVTVLVTDATCELNGTVAVEAVSSGAEPLQYDFNQQGFSPNPLYQSVPAGNYLLSVRNGEAGCPFRTVVVVGGEQNVVFIPNAFTPDGNEANNVWGIKGTCISEIRCRIFNRWGEEVATLIDMSQEWDGTFNGSIVPDGIYVYQAEVTYISQYKEAITGFVSVLR